MTKGKVKVGQDVEIIGYDKKYKCKVNGIEMFHKTLEEGQAGDQMGILVKGVKKNEVRRGMAAIKPGSTDMHDTFKAQIYILNKDEGGLAQPVTNKRMMLCFSRTWDCSGLVCFDTNKEMLMPGEDASVTMRLMKRMVMVPGQQITFRTGNSTIGTGKVTKQTILIGIRFITKIFFR